MKKFLSAATVCFLLTIALSSFSLAMTFYMKSGEILTGEMK